MCVKLLLLLLIIIIIAVVATTIIICQISVIRDVIILIVFVWISVSLSHSLPVFVIPTLQCRWLPGITYSPLRCSVSIPVSLPVIQYLVQLPEVQLVHQ